MRLSLRLSTLARLIETGKRVADIGTDHGYLPAYLLSAGICPQVYCCDVNPQPLKRAARTFAALGLERGVSFLCADGLQGLRASDVDVAVIAGMGGDLIAEILENGFSDGRNYQNVTFLLQPMSKAEKLRAYLAQNGFLRTDEILVEEDGKIFVIMRCVCNGEKQDVLPEDIYFGAMHLTDQSDAAKKYLAACRARLKKVMDGKMKGGQDASHEAYLLSHLASPPETNS